MPGRTQRRVHTGWVQGGYNPTRYLDIGHWTLDIGHSEIKNTGDEHAGAPLQGAFRDDGQRVNTALNANRITAGTMRRYGVGNIPIYGTRVNNGQTGKTQLHTMHPAQNSPACPCMKRLIILT